MPKLAAKVKVGGKGHLGTDAERIEQARKKVVKRIDQNIAYLNDPVHRPKGNRTPKALWERQGDKAYVFAKYGTSVVELDDTGTVAVEADGTSLEDIIAAFEWLKDYLAAGNADRGLAISYNKQPLTEVKIAVPD